MDAQSETQLTMWQEMFEDIGSKNLTELGAIKTDFIIVSPNFAVLRIVYKDGETALKEFQSTNDKISELSKFLKMEINEGRYFKGKKVFSLTSLTNE